MEASLFGSRARYELLLGVGLLEESHLSELSRLLARPYRSVYTMVESLENAGVLSTKLVGNARMVSLNPRYFAAGELKALLDKLIRKEPELQDQLSQARRRSRRIGKPI